MTHGRVNLLLELAEIVNNARNAMNNVMIHEPASPSLSLCMLILGMHWD